MEICQVQLMSLANKVHDTEINHDIDPYLNDINTLFEDSSKDELIKKFFSVEFTRFHNYYLKAKDLNISAQNSSERDTGHENSTRYFINVGKKDGFDWMSLKDFLKETLELGRDDVFKVDVKDSFSFFNTETKDQEKVFEIFKDLSYNGRSVNVEITQDTGRSRNRNRGGDRRRSGGGDRRRSDRRSDKRFEGNSGNRSNRRSGGKNESDKRSDRRSSDNKSSGSSRPRRSRR